MNQNILTEKSKYFSVHSNFLIKRFTLVGELKMERCYRTFTKTKCFIYLNYQREQVHSRLFLFAQKLLADSW